ncbi:hypothetical protein QWZ16_17535 [Vibrio ostreicida]|uniref:Uncharacterized protein n=1 Tax=Vibrio ostreicida TaxID=526588 RepID=A0ABT8BZD3_9VIBR|nr:hypothetical protein [Vibrio ostreicida]MDN3611405.1 hypothetical protein [Vibrio ostreicida]
MTANAALRCDIRLAILELSETAKRKESLLNGKFLAASLISHVPELGFIANKHASSLIGVAPITRKRGL